MTQTDSPRPAPVEVDSRPAAAEPTAAEPAAAEPTEPGRSRPGRHRATGIRPTGGSVRPGTVSRRRRTVALAAAVLGGLGLTGAGSGHASATELAGPAPDSHAVVQRGGPAAAVPAVLTPPADVVKVATYRVAFGVQIYRCDAGAWVFKEPAAFLVNASDRRRTIYHFGGPSWQSLRDDSLVTAGKLAESPVPGAIPQLLLGVKTHSGGATGELSRVSHIQRLSTRGGVAPTGACTAGAERPVPYGADYVLFAPR